MIKIAIVEDEISSAKLLEGYIKRYAEEKGELFDIDFFRDGNEITSNYKPFYHIIFLDIQMRYLDGMATAEFIRKLDREVILIFITNMAQYAIKGYSVDALDFLLKPVPYFAFSQQLKRSIEQIKRRQASFILLSTDIGVLKLDVSRIVFIESFKHKKVVHTADESYSLYSTMDKLESGLSGKNFFRCNKSYLINLAYVEAVKGGSVLIGGHTVSISRTVKKAFMDALAEHIGG